MTTKPTRGQEWLNRVLDEYALELDGEVLAAEIADLMDRADALREKVASGPLIQESPQGEKVAPAVGELRATQALLRQSLATLGISE
ncbi:hypothetical protein G5C66_07740 [Nocardioides sp. KC13]|uniref:Uncharacterized protein n=1 Tax=Nocardioides turkmenicus TaxID=2711220 RepID=A0A6M1QY75_9ACTN|nr:hypothetical protein [Nocardioides sp. KC13]NGN92630.1 hypothetical protein [Nocardioides sp. KC13]